MIRILIFLFSGAFLCSTAQALEIKVVRAKGQRAVVEFPNRAEPKDGEIYFVKSLDPLRQEKSDRDMTLAAAVGLTSDAFPFGIFALTTTTTSPSQTTINNSYTVNLNVRAGWNMKVLEFGPLLVVQMNSSGTSNGQLTTTTTSQTYGGGGFVDWNFIPNEMGNKFIVGLGGSGAFGQTTVTSSAPSVVATLTQASTGPYAKIFLGPSATALRFDLVYYYKTTASTNLTATTTGPTLTFGLQTYF